MSIGVSTDYLGLATTNLKVTNAAENATINTAEAVNERGDIVARATYESLTAPSCEYTVCGDYDMTTFALGELKATDFIINGFTISTAGGTAPKVTATAGLVTSGAVEGYTYPNPAFTLKSAFEAQALFAAFALTADEDNYIQSCNATGQCSLPRGLDESGETCAFDVSGATIEVTAEICMLSSTVPTITPAANWTVTSPATPTETNTAYTIYSITLRYTPAAVAASA